MGHDINEIRRRLAAVGQEHLLQFVDRISDRERQSLLAQIADLDLEALPRLIELYVRNKPNFTMPPNLAPAEYYPFDAHSARRPWDRRAMRLAGEKLVAAGNVACFTVAGGQGSRLGYEGPKGCYPAGAVTERPLFGVFADALAATERKFGVAVPWYIMTSPLNHDATVKFFDDQEYFGLQPRNVRFFKQGVMPSLDIQTGKILMASPSEVATNPDGHGGAVRALHVSGAIADMKSRGVQHLSYFQVDNPIVRCVDPVFIGLHAVAPDSSGEMSSKMIPKLYPEEKLGVFCRANGKTEVIEYSDLPADLQAERLPDGSLRFIAGSIAIHVIAVDFLEKLATDPAFELPYHRAEKKVPCIDMATGELVQPTKNNGVKLEKFIFDALSMCGGGRRGSIVYETDRIEEFAPIKNATGVDSPESSRKIQTERAARWLESRAVKVPRNAAGEPECVLEVSPLTAMDADDLNGKSLPASIERGARVVI